MKVTVIRYKVTRFIDLNNYDVYYGVMAKVDKNWFPVSDGHEPLLFKEKDEAQKYVNKINSQL